MLSLCLQRGCDGQPYALVNLGHLLNEMLLVIWCLMWGFRFLLLKLIEAYISKWRIKGRVGQTPPCPPFPHKLSHLQLLVKESIPYRRTSSPVIFEPALAAKSSAHASSYDKAEQALPSLFRARKKTCWTLPPLAHHTQWIPLFLGPCLMVEPLYIYSHSKYSNSSL
jgi:hypothetical protein